MKHVASAGYHLDCLVGFSRVEGHRANGASGGLVTWTLEMLLEKGVIDRAICVASTPGQPPLFRSKVCSRSVEIRECSGSSYYPVEFSRVLHEVLTVEARYAIVALPCVAKALRLAARKNKTLGDRICYVLGLTCGQSKSAFFTEYTCALAGGDPAGLEEVRFRIKDPQRSARDHGIQLTWTQDGVDRHTRTIFWEEGPGRAWSKRYFTPEACNYCDDVFAETADASFMDAWLPPYVSDSAGTSIVVIRHPILRSLFAEGVQAGTLQAAPISVDAAIESQRSARRAKGETLRKRLYLAKRRKERVPCCRTPVQGRMPLRKLVGTWLELKGTHASRVAFAEDMEAAARMRVFGKRMRLWRSLESVLSACHRLANLVHRIIAVLHQPRYDSPEVRSVKREVRDVGHHWAKQ
jgi:coenzyme F420-reducing hydrogenase beta subunit